MSSSIYEKDVLPSKSMKMKVSISPSMSTSKKKASSTKDSEDTSATSKTETVSKRSSVATAVENSTSIEIPPAVELATVPPIVASPAVSTPAVSTPAVSTPAVSTPAVSTPAPPISLAVGAPDKSQSTDSMTSFTVPEECTFRTKNLSISGARPSTPTATTLSGSGNAESAASAANVVTTVEKDTTKSPVAGTAAATTPASAAPIAPTSTGQTAPAPPVTPLASPVPVPPTAPSTPAPPPTLPTTPQPPTSEKKQPPARILNRFAESLAAPRGGAAATTMHDDRLRNRYEACRSGMQELDVLRAKHTLLIQNLRSRLPVIPGSLDAVQTREKKNRDGFLDRFSLQSVDSGISSQNTLSSTRSSTPEDLKSMRHSNIYENSTSTMTYSTFRKLSLDASHSNPGDNNNEVIGREKLISSAATSSNPSASSSFAPPVITSRSCHRGAWKTSPGQRVRPKSMFDSSTSSAEYLCEKPPRTPIEIGKDRRSAFTAVHQSSKRHSCVEPASLPHSFTSSQLSLNEDHTKVPFKAEVVRRNKQKADAMFRANVVYVGSGSGAEIPAQKAPPVRFSPARSPPVRRAIPIELSSAEHFGQPCKIRSPNSISPKVFAAKPIAVRPFVSPKIAQRSTWLQSQPL
uniref:Uncharacterized protein n=1 Tax=Caenorhabditis japonica TaxID=281687 RepID=A0A8R1I1B9_CAEJA